MQSVANLILGTYGVKNGKLVLTTTGRFMNRQTRYCWGMVPAVPRMKRIIDEVFEAYGIDCFARR